MIRWTEPMIPSVGLMLLFSRLVLIFVRPVLIPAPPHRRFARLLLIVINFRAALGSQEAKFTRAGPTTTSRRPTPKLKPSNTQRLVIKRSLNPTKRQLQLTKRQLESAKRKLRATKTLVPQDQKFGATANIPGRAQQFSGGRRANVKGRMLNCTCGQAKAAFGVFR